MKRIILLKCFSIFLICTVVMACSDDDQTVVPSKNLEFAVTPSDIVFGSGGGNNIININGNAPWTISGEADWISFSSREGSSPAKITLNALQNPDTLMRNATFTVQSGEASSEIQISQMIDSITEADFEYAIPPDNTGMSDLNAVAFADEIGNGWNLGNSLEAVGGETAWGNPMVTRQLIDSVKAAGFDAVRIPVAWSKFSNEEDYTIEESWMNRVEEVVNYVLDNDMYAVMNIHWDGGWMQPTYAEQEEVNARLEIMWTQIATNFRDYDDHLLFAGTNEVMVEGDYGTPTEEYYTVQNSFNQTFVTAVRATGGRNAYRYLVVQGYNTNIDHTVNFAEIPEDVTEERLMMEVHYYDPYNFALNENSEITQWGNDAEDEDRVEDWANEDHVDAQFNRMKTNFIDQGIPVILGEFGAISRQNVEGHDAYREYYNEYITQSAVAHDLIPFYWDNGFAGNYGFAIFDREDGSVIEPGLVNVLTVNEE